MINAVACSHGMFFMPWVLDFPSWLRRGSGGGGRKSPRHKTGAVATRLCTLFGRLRAFDLFKPIIERENLVSTPYIHHTEVEAREEIDEFSDESGHEAYRHFVKKGQAKSRERGEYNSETCHTHRPARCT